MQIFGCEIGKVDIKAFNAVLSGCARGVAWDSLVGLILTMREEDNDDDDAAAAADDDDDDDDDADCLIVLIIFFFFFFFLLFILFLVLIVRLCQEHEVMPQSSWNVP